MDPGKAVTNCRDLKAMTPDGFVDSVNLIPQSFGVFIVVIVNQASVSIFKLNGLITTGQVVDAQDLIVVAEPFVESCGLSVSCG